MTSAPHLRSQCSESWNWRQLPPALPATKVIFSKTRDVTGPTQKGKEQPSGSHVPVGRYLPLPPTVHTVPAKLQSSSTACCGVDSRGAKDSKWSPSRTPRWLRGAPQGGARQDNSLAIVTVGDVPFLSGAACQLCHHIHFLLILPTSFPHRANSSSSDTQAGTERWGSLCGHSHGQGTPNVTGCLAKYPTRSLETLSDNIPNRQRDREL